MKSGTFRELPDFLMPSGRAVSKYFYRPVPMRDLMSIITDLEDLETTSDGMLAEIMGGLMDEHESI